MKAKLIDGKGTSAQIKEDIKREVNSLKDDKNIVPGLAVILLGEDDASRIYVRSKKRACEYVGIKSFEYTLPEKTTQQELLKLISECNDNTEIDGILVQLPLPAHIDKETVIGAIAPHKDVDGFHPENVGKLVANNCLLISCTPAGIIELLDRYEVDIKGKNAVIVGRSDIVGKPISLLLLHRHATVTICHSKTANLPEVTKGADILVAAIGRANFITGDMVKEGAVVIDVGINRENGVLVGDVAFSEVAEIASFITPVPGGVGPMTISMLLKNTLIACKNTRLL